MSLVADFKKGSVRALSRLISQVENQELSATESLAALYPPAKAARVLGITGPPGAGKSSLLARFVANARAVNERVAVIAVDPVSPFTGGALLGDRIRLSDHFTDEGVFIRSLSTRGKLGGLTAATRQVVHLAEAFGFDWVLVETVGVGQSEVDVRSIVDLTIVTLVPEAGDSVQAIKAGLMEIADLFIVNKSDREGADRLTQDLRAALEIAGREDVKVVKSSTKETTSVDAVWSDVRALFDEKKAAIVTRRAHGTRDTVSDALESLASREARKWVERHVKQGKNPYRVLVDFLQQHPPEKWFSS